MSLVTLQWNPTTRQLRQFAVTGAVVAPLITGLVTRGAVWPTLAALALGAIVAAAGWKVPRLVRPLFVGASLITYPIGLVMSEVVIGLTFYGVIVPLGLAARVVGRDVLQLKIHREAATYWQPKSQPANVERNFRQY